MTFVMVATELTVALMALERLWSICYGFGYRKYVTRRRCRYPGGEALLVRNI